MIRATQGSVPIAERCRVLNVARSGYYAWRRRPVSARLEQDGLLLERIQSIHANSSLDYCSPVEYEERIDLSPEKLDRLKVEGGKR